ncbi:hypothetical protein NDN08_001476 [Rhodosorus marinus]|uniref:PCI domain-containing protein n=1 Tax=Rhodosorus marinus TaxID=101924 RepID=A0AAV8UR41_9RHOD|nr:hypothetical protein NDN08_001476 [Rhodosorus marinus]
MDLYTSFAQQCAYCIRTRDGVGLSNLLKPENETAKEASIQYLRQPSSTPFTQSLSPDYAVVVERLLAARGAVAAMEWYDAFSLHNLAMQALFKEYDDLSMDNWLCGPIVRLCTEHRIIAQEAYEQARRRNQRLGTLSTAEETIRKFFRKSVQDKTNEMDKTKKHAVLALSVQLFKIHFKLNTLNLCTDVTRLIDSMILDVIDFESFAMAHKVAYSYFVGRLALYDENYKSANKNLTYAFVRCPPSAKKNKHQIAQFLVCARLNIGVLPRMNMLKKYRLSQFMDIVTAARSGNILGFERCLAEHQRYFIVKGIYLSIERLQKIVYRSLVRKTFLILQPTKGTRIPLKAFNQVAEGIGADVGEDEMECILANLIFEGLMKGYISHKRKMLVLSNQTAFPSMSSVFGAGPT